MTVPTTIIQEQKFEKEEVCFPKYQKNVNVWLKDEVFPSWKTEVMPMELVTDFDENKRGVE